VGGFRYLPRQDAADGRIKDYRFYVSADGVTWGSPVAQGVFANNGDEKSVAVSETWTPDISGPGAQSSMVGETIRLPIQAVDHDGDPLSYAASGLPPGLTIDNAGVIAGTIANALNSIGAYEVTITVRDSRGFASSVAFTWTVQAQALMLNPITSTPKPVNTPVGYTAIGNNGINPRYKWQFGDGTAETAYSSSSHASHSYSQPGIYMVRLTATDDRGVEQSITFVQAIHLPLTARRPAASTSIAYEQRTTSNSRVWVVNADNDTVAVFDAETNAKLAELPAGPAPRSVAVGPMGSVAAGRVWVSNKGTANSGASITVLDTHPLGVVGSISLPVAAQPYGLVFAPDGSAAYVALEAMGQVLKLDPGTGNMLGSVAVGPDPRHLSVSADGRTLLVARFVTPPLPGEATAAVQTTLGGAKVGGEVVVVNTASMSTAKAVVLQFGEKNDSEVQGRGVPNYLGAPAISPDGSAAWVPSKQDNVQRGVLRDGNNLNFQNTVRAISSRIELVGLSEDYNSRIDHDNAGVASSAVFDPYGVYLFVTLETSREVAVVDVFGRRELFRIAVGRAPQGLAVSPDGTRLYVNNFMDRTVSVLDIATLVKQGSNGVPVVKTLAAVTSEKLGAQVMAGKQLFYDAKDPRLALDAYVSCAACHSDGGQDGRVWDMTGFGEGLRNTVSLRGRSGMGQGPLHWSANFDEVQDFEGQIRKLSGGTGLMSNADFAAAQDPQGAAKAGRSADLDALAAYVASLNSFDVSPYRSGDGALTSAGAAGKAVFQTANCANCHGGTSFTNSAPGNLPDIGTLKPSSGNRASGPLSGLDIPTLRDVWRTAPYLHDGSAQTLADAVRAHDNVAVNDSDLATLVAYLQQVDAWEPVAPASTQVTPVATPIATPLPGVTPEPVATPTATPIISDPEDVPPVTPVPQEGSIVPGSWIKPLYLPYVVR
jgi:YVTN family beta-propeller protein